MRVLTCWLSLRTSKKLTLDDPKTQVTELYGSRLRVRVSGLCLSDERILMIRHKSLGPDNIFWSPPGGGMQFGESAKDALKREILEETGLIAEVGELLFVNEFIHAPLHAVELFFQIESFSGSIITGSDPEFSKNNQIIMDTRFMSMKEIKKLPENQVHNLFKKCNKLEEVLSLRGYISNF